MLTAIAFLCALSAVDCQAEATEVYTVGEGNTPASCLIDGYAGAARNGLSVRDGERLVIACRRR